MNPQDLTAQAQQQMDEIKQLTGQLEKEVANHQLNVDGYAKQIEKYEEKIAAEQKAIEKITADYRARIDVASKESQRLSTKASQLAK